MATAYWISMANLIATQVLRQNYGASIEVSQNIKIEADSLEAVLLINGEEPNHPHRALIDDPRLLLN